MQNYSRKKSRKDLWPSSIQKVRGMCYCSYTNIAFIAPDVQILEDGRNFSGQQSENISQRSRGTTTVIHGINNILIKQNKMYKLISQGGERRKRVFARRKHIIKCCGHQSCINPIPRKRNRTSVTEGYTLYLLNKLIYFYAN